MRNGARVEWEYEILAMNQTGNGELVLGMCEVVELCGVRYAWGMGP